MAKSSHVHVLLWYSRQGRTRFRSFQSTLFFSPYSQMILQSNICPTWLIITTAESSLAANFYFLWRLEDCYTQKTHLIADTERHLGNFDIDKGVIHSCSFLHLIDVVNWMLEGWHCTMHHYLIYIKHPFGSCAAVKIPIPLEVSWMTSWPLQCGSVPGQRLCWGPWHPWCPLMTAEPSQGYL